MIIRNGVRHNTSSFGGSGNANIVKLTQSEYDALPESKKSDGILYAITDGECSASGGSSKPVELTREEYEALGDKVNSDGILYAITDGDGLSAKSMAFDDTETQLGVNNVQDAIVEQNKKNAGELLWTNPDITSEFASQTITFDFEDYEFLEIYYVFHRTISVFLSQKCLANHSTVICMNDVNSIYRRNITVSNGGLLISTCDGYTIKTNTGFSNNEYIIPYKIYGLK